MTVRRARLGATVAPPVPACRRCRRRGLRTSRRDRRAPIAAAALRGSNVLLITIDTLRADHVGAYGSPHGLTPTIDGFAKAGASSAPTRTCR